MSLRIVVVDDHAVVRSGIRMLLDAQEDLEVVAEASDARSAIFELRAHKPDVVLLDVVMPGRSGIDVIPDLLKESPETKVLLLSMQDDPAYVREAFAAGAATC
jgi:two-component system response regulator NreC